MGPPPRNGGLPVPGHPQLPAVLHVRLAPLPHHAHARRKQVHDETWRKQVEMWADLVLAYCRASRVFVLDAAVEAAPFGNPAIARKAPGPCTALTGD